MCLGLIGESVYDTGFTLDLVDDLDSRRSFHADFWSTEGYFWWFQSIGDIFVAFDLLGIFLPFLDVYLNFPLHFQPPENSVGIFEFFFFLLNYT